MKIISTIMLNNQFQLIFKVLSLPVNIELLHMVPFSQNSLFSPITGLLTSPFKNLSGSSIGVPPYLGQGYLGVNQSS